MKREKQEVLLAILNSGHYEVDIVEAKIYALRKRGRVLLKTNLLPTGYRQITLFKGRNTGVKGIFYVHQVIYLAANGLYDETKEIDHNDRDNTNNRAYNLVLRTPAANKANTERSYYPTDLKLIRGNEIAQIRTLHAAGYSQQSIAKQLGLNRLSCRYVIKRIEAGLPLKYEQAV